jgi:hypothetical protein
MDQMLARKVAAEALLRTGNPADAAAVLNANAITTTTGKPFTARRIRVLARQAERGDRRAG